jgi:hypothetical protein
MGMRTVGIALLITALSAPAVFAAPNVPLTPGKPAGVRQAQEDGRTMLLVAGAALVGIGVALSISNGGNNATTTSTSSVSTTGTTP